MQSKIDCTIQGLRRFGCGLARKPPYKVVPARKRMTIAIGMRCIDGVIIAADREEGNAYSKNDVGKIFASVRGSNPVGQIAIAGAGSGPYIDEVSKILTDEFCEEMSGLEQIVGKHRDYYGSVVMPMSVYGVHDAPNYDLVIGSVGGRLPRGVYSTNGLAFNRSDDYEAVGAGAMIAKEWLDRLWDYVPVLYAARLAAYVIFHVKNSVPGCGHGTDIIILRENAMPARVASAGVRKWEDIFRTTYKRLDRNVFYHAMGLDLNPQYLSRTELGREAIDKRLDDVQREIGTSVDKEAMEGL